MNATIKSPKARSSRWEDFYQKKRREILAKESKPKKGKRAAWRRDVNKRAAEYADREMEKRSQSETTNDSPSASNEDSQNSTTIPKGNPTVRIHKQIPAKPTPSQPSEKATPIVQMPAKATPSPQPSAKPSPAPTPVKPTVGSPTQPAPIHKPGAKPNPIRVVKPGNKSSPAPNSKSTSAPTRIVVAAKPKRPRRVNPSEQ